MNSRAVNVKNGKCKCEYERGGDCAGDGQPGSTTGGRSTTFVISTGCLMSVLTDSHDTIFLSKRIWSITLYYICYILYSVYMEDYFPLLSRSCRRFLMVVQTSLTLELPAWRPGRNYYGKSKIQRHQANAQRWISNIGLVMTSAMETVSARCHGHMPCGVHKFLFRGLVL